MTRKKTDKATGRTELVFIMDKSGSMGGFEGDTIGGFNSLLAKQKALKGECRLTTVLFDNEYQLLHDRIEIEAVSPMTEKDYSAGGMTALLDAVGTTIGKIKAVQENSAKEYRADKVMFVIITDGQENASREYSAWQIKEQIKRQKKEGWEFIFLGANIDAVEAAAEIGISRERAAKYVQDKRGNSLNFKVINECAAAFRKCDCLSDCALDEIKRDQKKRGK